MPKFGFFDRIRGESAIGRVEKNKLFEQVATELANGEKNEGLWLQALTAADGDEAKTNSEYIKLRVQAIKDENQIAVYSQNLLAQAAQDLARAEQDARVDEMIVKLRAINYFVKGSVSQGWKIQEPSGGVAKIKSLQALEEYANRRLQAAK